MSYDIHHLMLCYSVLKGPVGGPIGDGSTKILSAALDHPLLYLIYIIIIIIICAS